MRRPSLLAFLLLLFTRTFLASEEIPVGEPQFGPAPGRHYDVSVTADGENYIVVWQDWRTGFGRLRATRISGNGELLTPLGFPCSADTPACAARQTAVSALQTTATNGRTTYTVWIDAEGVKGQLLPFGEPQLLSVSANRQFAPAVATAGDITLVVWRETTGVYATRIAADGRSLDGRGIALSNTGWFTNAPQAVFDGEHFVVALSDWGGLAIRFLLPHNGRVQREQIRLRGVASFALAPRHVAWEGTDARIRVSRIDTAARTVEPVPVLVSPEGMSATMPAVASNGRETLVVWSERLRVAELGGIYAWEPSIIWGARLSSAFTLIDTAPLLVGDSPASEDRDPTVASNGEDWLVTWTVGVAVLSARVHGNGLVGEAVQIRDAYRGVVAWNGAEYVVAYKEWPEDVLHAGDVTFATRWSSRDLAFDGQAVAYTRISDEHGGVERVFIRRIASPAWPCRGTGKSLRCR